MPSQSFNAIYHFAIQGYPQQVLSLVISFVAAIITVLVQAIASLSCQDCYDY